MMKLIIILTAYFLIVSCDNTVIRSVGNIEDITLDEYIDKSKVDINKVKWYGKYQYDNLELDEKLGISYGITIDITLDKNNCIFEVAGTQVYEKFECMIEGKDNMIQLNNIYEGIKLASIKYSDGEYMIQTSYTHDDIYYVINMKPN